MDMAFKELHQQLDCLLEKYQRLQKENLDLKQQKVQWEQQHQQLNLQHKQVKERVDLMIIKLKQLAKQ